MNWRAAFPDLSTAGGLLAVWVWPGMIGPGWIAGAVGTFMLEFFVLHAGGFFNLVLYSGASRGARSGVLMTIAAVYLFLVGLLALGLHAAWMVGAFAWLTYGKIRAVWKGAADVAPAQAKKAAVSAWVSGLLCYLVAVTLTVALPCPPLGLTPQMIAAAHLPGSGLWIERPYTALAAGVLYFTAMGLLRARMWALILRHAPPAALAQA